MPQRPCEVLPGHHGAAGRPVRRPRQPRQTLRRRGACGRADRRLQEADRQGAGDGTQGADRPSVFLYDSGRDAPYTSGRYAAPEQIITEAGGVNLMHDLADSWTTVGWESVVQRNPDVIVVCDYGDVSAEQKKEFLLSYPPLRNVSAVKHRRIVSLDYAGLVESPRNPAAIARLGAYLRTVQADR
ncbi:ABC transporter substrate-binding protein [Streptomyces nogalater]